MPANLPPQYYEEEKKLKEAKTPDEKIKIIERMLAIIPHHKGTDKLIGSLRAKIAKLKEEKEKKPQTRKGIEALYNVKKEGAAQVLFLGFPNAGKSSCVAALSGEYVEIADYPYTTKMLQPRMMRYEDIWIQLVDTPAIGDDSTNMWFGNMVRKADLILIVISVEEDLFTEYELIMEELSLHTKEVSKPYIVVVNKMDLAEHSQKYEEFEKALKAKGVLSIPFSATHFMNLHELKEQIFIRSDIIRVYSKLPGKKPDMEVPFTLKRGSTILDFAEGIHKDFVKRLKYARLWRSNVLAGMMVSKDFLLEDKDIVELHV
ncbi:MAG: 50S ribosome-binding GTPase [Desulfobacterota bacterium]|nr:50S ribosome-binding GTPase [Thermodesulfobacteriota bacterium]MDW8001605.1 GTPase [Deltaproteobacteria bacterium]